MSIAQATDLETVYFESLTSPGLAARFIQIDEHDQASSSRKRKTKRPHLQHKSISESQEVDIRRRMEEELVSLEKMMGDDWEDAEMSIESDDYFVS